MEDEAEFARLRQGYEDERLAEQAEYEELAAKDHLRRRELSDVVRELVHRGDRVTVVAGGQTFAGEFTHAAGDLACLRTRIGEVDLNLGVPTVIRVVERVAQGGRSPAGGAKSFKARLFEHEAAGFPVEVGGQVPGGELTGRIDAVATDHVVMSELNGHASVVPLTLIAYVMARASA